MRKQELVNWYLGEVQEDISSMEELAEMKLKVEKIIDKLVHHVSVAQVYSDGWVWLIINVLFQDRVLLQLLDAESEGGEDKKNPVLVVHPNYFIET